VFLQLSATSHGLPQWVEFSTVIVMMLLLSHDLNIKLLMITPVSVQSPLVPDVNGLLGLSLDFNFIYFVALSDHAAPPFSLLLLLLLLTALCIRINPRARGRVGVAAEGSGLDVKPSDCKSGVGEERWVLGFKPQPWGRNRSRCGGLGPGDDILDLQSQQHMAAAGMCQLLADFNNIH